MNHAPTTGYEEDVGARSTIRVVSHTSVPLLLRNQPYFFQQSQETLYIIWGPAKKMNREKVGLTYQALVKVMERYPQLQIYTLTEEKMTYCDDVFQNETGKNRYCQLLRNPPSASLAVSAVPPPGTHRPAGMAAPCPRSSMAAVLCRLKSGSFLSTGWFTMILAMELCEQIYVFGMVSDSYCRCVGGSEGGWGVVWCPSKPHAHPVPCCQGEEPLECALPLLREGPAGRVQDVPDARASPPRRAPLHHREGHLLPLGQEEEHHLCPPILGRGVGSQPWGEAVRTLAVGQLSSCNEASRLCQCHG